MINRDTKQKLVDSFNQVTRAIHNLKTDIASEGSKAFMCGNTQDIVELAEIAGKINELQIKADKIASGFKTYALDIATETHPSEFPLPNIEQSKKLYPIICYVSSINNKIKCKVEITSKSRLKIRAGSNLIYPSKANKRILNRYDKLLALNILENDKDTLIVKRDIEFKNANTLLSFVEGKETKDGETKLITENGKTISELKSDYIDI